MDKAVDLLGTSLTSEILKIITQNSPHRLTLFNSNREILLQIPSNPVENESRRQSCIPEFNFDRLHPEDESKLLAHWNDIAITGIPSPTFDYRIQDAEGDWALIESRFIKMEDKDKGPVMLMFSRDTGNKDLNISDSRFRKIVERMNQGLLYSNEEGIILFVNERFLEITGYSRNEIIGNNGYELLLDDSERLRLENKVHSRINGESEQYEAKLINKKGETIWVKINAAPDYDERGRFAGIMSLITDISGEKEQAIRQEAIYKISRATHRKILDIKSMSRLIHEEISKVLEAGNFYLALYNEKTDTVTFPYFTDERVNEPYKRKSFEDRKFGKGLTERVIRGRKSILINETTKAEFLKSSSHEQEIVSWLGVPIKIDGQVVGMMAIQSYQHKNAYDEDDKKFMSHLANQAGQLLESIRAFDEIIKNEGRFRTLIERNLAGVYRYSLNGTLMECNDSFAHIIGFKNKEEILGKNVRDLIINLTNEKIYDRIKIHGHSVNGLESQLLLNNGKDVWIVENSGLIIDADGNNYIEGTMMDITKEKRSRLIAEEERKQAMEYQSQLLSSQINPHFIFNALNSVQYYILDQDPEPALTFISEFSSLMRKVLNNSLHKFITIKEEVEFLTLYLGLERKRYQDEFEFEIRISGKIDEKDYQIPPMLIQPYVENTVIHGIGNKKGKGKITVNFECDDKHMNCIIQDDGVGREKAAELKVLKTGARHKSLGMGITATRLGLLNQITGNSFTVDVEDIYNEEGIGCGTIIYIKFPIISEDKFQD